MSGGHFDYAFTGIADLVSRLREEIKDNGSDVEDEYGDRAATDFDPETVAILIRCVDVMERASSIAHDVEWLFSGDYGEESFRGLAKEELAQLRKILERDNA